MQPAEQSQKDGGRKPKSAIGGLLPLENLEHVTDSASTRWQIVLAIIATAFVFAYDASVITNTFGNIPIALFSVAVAILVHEWAHGVVAAKFRIDASFKLFMPGFIVSLLLAVVGIKVAVVGAASVASYKFGRFGFRGRTPAFRERGWIGGVGPLANIALGALCGLLFEASGVYIFQYMMTVNAWIALFNLVPIKELDGGNLFYWKPSFWFLLIVLAVILLTPFGILSNIPPVSFA
jgi:Zn-dependent protease